jgi:hypothetical protein
MAVVGNVLESVLKCLLLPKNVLDSTLFIACSSTNVYLNMNVAVIPELLKLYRLGIVDKVHLKLYPIEV